MKGRTGGLTAKMSNVISDIYISKIKIEGNRNKIS